MANTIAHLAIAKEMLRREPNFIQNQDAFYLGVLAPDAIAGKPGTIRADKLKVHLRENIPDVHWTDPEYMELFHERAKSFAREYVTLEKDKDQRDFNLGYLVHLLTDKCNFYLMLPKILVHAKELGYQFGTPEVVAMCTNDLNALDQYLLDTYPDIAALFDKICMEEVHYGLKGWVDREYVEGARWWWVNVYLPAVGKCELRYVEPADMEEFIVASVDRIFADLEYLFRG